MSVRMNGAEPDEIYMGNLASNARMILDTYDQFTHGLAPLFASFAREYDVRSGTAAEELLFANGRAVGVRVRSELGATSELRGCGVVLAAPANVAARLTAPRLPALARELGSIAYHPVALVVAEYDRPVFTSAARAFVFDERHPVSNAGAYGMRDRHLVRYTFSGRAARALIADATDETLVALGEAALAAHVPLDAAWRRRSVTTRFATGLCAYAPHHATLIDRIHAELDAVQGLYVTGDYLRGASIEACFRAAYSCAHHLAGRETRYVLKSA
jgi:oxygen-dependent protoporphyrinogen oxidase